MKTSSQPLYISMPLSPSSSLMSSLLPRSPVLSPPLTRNHTGQCLSTSPCTLPLSLFLSILLLFAPSSVTSQTKAARVVDAVKVGKTNTLFSEDIRGLNVNPPAAFTLLSLLLLFHFQQMLLLTTIPHSCFFSFPQFFHFFRCSDCFPWPSSSKSHRNYFTLFLCFIIFPPFSQLCGQILFVYFSL